MTLINPQSLLPSRASLKLALRCGIFAALLLVIVHSGGNVFAQSKGKEAEIALQEASGLNEEVVKLYRAGKYDEAIPLAKRALAIYEKALGADPPSTAGSLNNLATLYDSKGDYAQAELLYRRALAIYDKAFGVDHPDSAS